TACVVLMFTTAAPWSSTSLTKSGNSRPCARAAPLKTKASASSASRFLTHFMCDPLLLGRLPELNRGGDALHADRGRLADDRHDVVRHFARIDLERAEAGWPGPHGFGPPGHRFDEHRYRRQAVRIHHLTDRPRLAQPARDLDDLAETRQLRAQRPAAARQVGGRHGGILDAPVLRLVPRLHALARHAADGKLGEGKLVHSLALV